MCVKMHISAKEQVFYWENSWQILQILETFLIFFVLPQYTGTVMGPCNLLGIVHLYGFKVGKPPWDKGGEKWYSAGFVMPCSGFWGFDATVDCGAFVKHTNTQISRNLSEWTDGSIMDIQSLNRVMCRHTNWHVFWKATRASFLSLFIQAVSCFVDIF